MREQWFCQHCHVLMDYDADADRFVCPQCGVEVWFPMSDSEKSQEHDELYDMMRDMSRTHGGIEPLPAGEALKGGGGSNAAGKKNGPAKKCSQQQLYNQLFKQT